MGYFPNGSAGDDYESRYCNRCIHENEEKGCAVLLAHLIHNYAECNKKDSILHLLIPLDEQGFNQQCRMFVAAPKETPLKLTAQERRRLELEEEFLNSREG